MQALTRYGRRMIRRLPAPAALALSMAAALAPLPAAAQAKLNDSGPIGTVERGRYVCELPGRADGPAGIAQEDQGFRITSASRYATSAGEGTYLRRGNVLVMTTGPHKGERYLVVSSGFLRRLEQGRPGPLRCVRSAR
ncbi:conserved hypothetical protein [Altererythrobacter sp. B11]|nr:conserved hypothetical protein [Altererythrobacter sp. B11]